MSINSLDAVKRKIQSLQQQADDAEDRAQILQRELDNERNLREKVRDPALPRRSFVLSFFFSFLLVQFIARVGALKRERPGLVVTREVFTMTW